MRPKQMLEAVVEKAIKNGFSAKSLDSEIENGRITFCEDPYDIVVDQMYISTVEVLFNRKFALAYWGQEVVCADCGELVQSKGWEAWCSGFCADKFRPKASTLQWVYHLKETVLSEDPLLYYYQHL